DAPRAERRAPARWRCRPGPRRARRAASTDRLADDAAELHVERALGHVDAVALRARRAPVPAAARDRGVYLQPIDAGRDVLDHSARFEVVLGALVATLRWVTDDDEASARVRVVQRANGSSELERERGGGSDHHDCHCLVILPADRPAVMRGPVTVRLAVPAETVMRWMPGATMMTTPPATTGVTTLPCTATGFGVRVSAKSSAGSPTEVTVTTGLGETE